MSSYERNEERGPRKLTSGLYVLDAASKPKGITIYARSHDGETGRHDLSGIYKLEDNHLTIAYCKDGPRPETFESTPGSGVTLIVLEREMPSNDVWPKTPASIEMQQSPAAADPRPT